MNEFTIFAKANGTSWWACSWDIILIMKCDIAMHLPLAPTLHRSFPGKAPLQCDSGISVGAIFVDAGREGIHINHKAISFLSRTLIRVYMIWNRDFLGTHVLLFWFQSLTRSRRITQFQLWNFFHFHQFLREKKGEWRRYVKVAYKMGHGSDYNYAAPVNHIPEISPLFLLQLRG